MADYAGLIRGKIALASNILRSLQPTVSFAAWIGQNGRGKDQFASPVSYQALVDRSVKQKYSAQGRLVTVIATLTILDPVANTTANAGQTRINPIDPRDLFVLDDGTTAPIVEVKQFEDAGLLRPFLSEVTLGVTQ